MAFSVLVMAWQSIAWGLVLWATGVGDVGVASTKVCSAWCGLVFGVGGLLGLLSQAVKDNRVIAIIVNGYFMFICLILAHLWVLGRFVRCVFFEYY